MTGRGIDQVLPHPCPPRLYEPYIKSAAGYVELAEQANGVIPKPVDFSYIWGDALAELARISPDARIINLETAVTKSEDYEEKGINYRMNPENVSCITAAGIDCCSLANNHLLDWGSHGLMETVTTLRNAGLKTAGAGSDLGEAEAPAVIDIGEKGRIVLFACGVVSSGIPAHWAATEKSPGVNRLRDLSEGSVIHIGERIGEIKQQGDVTVVSIHWGANWGYAVPEEQKEFARSLIDRAGIDVVHGHSSHHFKGIEIYQGKLILYGCGDFLNDYEGIAGYEQYRPDIGLMYFASLNRLDGTLHSLQMIPTQVKRFRINRASEPDAVYARDLLNREGRSFGTRVQEDAGHILSLQWDRR